MSDSLIVFSHSASEEALQQIISMIKEICRTEFVENGILIRGAITKGQFDEIKAENLFGLQKGLIVGQAYVDAYIMEESFKAMGIALSDDVNKGIEAFQINEDVVSETRKDNSTLYVLKYLTTDFLSEETTLKQYIGLAIESNWLPHYYNTMGIRPSFRGKLQRKQKIDFLIVLLTVALQLQDMATITSAIIILPK